MKKAVKRGLTQRLRARVKMGDTDSDTDSEEDKVFNSNRKNRKHSKFMDALRLKDLNENNTTDGVTDGIEDGNEVVGSVNDAEKSGQQSTAILVTEGDSKKPDKDEGKKNKLTGFQLPKLGSGMTSMSNLEQSMPADAVLNKESAVKVIKFVFLFFFFAGFHLLIMCSFCMALIPPSCRLE